MQIFQETKPLVFKPQHSECKRQTHNQNEHIIQKPKGNVFGTDKAQEIGHLACNGEMEQEYQDACLSHCLIVLFCGQIYNQCQPHQCKGKGINKSINMTETKGSIYK